MACICAVLGLLTAMATPAQVITVDSRTGTVTNNSNGTAGTVDRRFQQIKPTAVPLSKLELDAKTRLELIRLLHSEQGFAMRPFPRGHKGLTLVANGKLEPAGESYLAMITSNGTSAKAGERLVLTDIKFERTKIVFDLNGGPDRKHRFMRHVQIGVGNSTEPVVQGDGQEPVGARLTLAFQDRVPELTGADVKALLAPLISFDLKTPIQAFTDTLPSTLKDAILNHHVMVGMTTDMLLYAKGQPESKSREMEGQMPFEEWIYGHAPKDVEFVRINGNRVIRVEVAKMGEKPVIFTKDEVQGMMRTDGTPLTAGADPGTRKVEMGDVQRNPDTQAPVAPPSLRLPGEKPVGGGEKIGVMKPVQMPKSKPQPQPGANPDGMPEASPLSSAQPESGDATQPGAAAQPAPQPAGSSQPH